MKKKNFIALVLGLCLLLTACGGSLDQEAVIAKIEDKQDELDDGFVPSASNLQVNMGIAKMDFDIVQDKDGDAHMKINSLDMGGTETSGAEIITIRSGDKYLTYNKAPGQDQWAEDSIGQDLDDFAFHDSFGEIRDLLEDLEMIHDEEAGVYRFQGRLSYDKLDESSQSSLFNNPGMEDVEDFFVDMTYEVDQETYLPKYIFIDMKDGFLEAMGDLSSLSPTDQLVLEQIQEEGLFVKMTIDYDLDENLDIVEPL